MAFLAPTEFVLPGEKTRLTNFVHSVAAAAQSNSSSSFPPPNDEAYIRMGPGISRSQDGFLPLYAATAHASEDGCKFWLDVSPKFYAPTAKDVVVGSVTSRHAEFYKVCIGGAQAATLSVLAFDGASKRNRPMLEVGDVVYARVLHANRDVEAELTCCGGTGDGIAPSGLGVLTGGACVAASNRFVKSVLMGGAQAKAVLQTLRNAKISFDVAAGMNNAVWMRGATLRETLLLVRFVTQAQEICLRSEAATPAEEALRQLLLRLKTQMQR